MSRRFVAKGTWISAFRPFASAEALPAFGVRSSGLYSVDPGWQDVDLQKYFYELFWGISGEGIFKIGDKDFTLHSESVLLLRPGDWHIIRSSSKWAYRWIAFDGSLADTVFKSLPEERSPFHAGTCPEELFERIAELIQTPSPQAQYMAAAAGLEIIYQAYSGSNANEKKKDAENVGDIKFDDALRIIDDCLADPSFDVTRLAERLRMHRTSLSRLFIQKIGIAPVKYLRAKRLQKAITLLKNGRMSISQIGSICGFASPEYFVRTVREATGMTPGQLRDSYGHQAK